MTERDIEKDKAFLSQWPETLVLVDMPLYYITKYESQQIALEIEQAKNEDLNTMNDHLNRVIYDMTVAEGSAHARIAELERQRDMFSKAIEERTERDRAQSDAMEKERSRWSYYANERGK